MAWKYEYCLAMARSRMAEVGKVSDFSGSEGG